MNEDESLLRTDRGKAWKDWLWVLFAVSFVLLLGLSVFLGRYPQAGFLRPGQLRENELARLLVLNIRLPRLLTAALLGMVLAASGTVFQMIFANPLVEPGFLGVSQGAAFGAAVAIVFLSASAAAVQGTAALCCVFWIGFLICCARIRVGVAAAAWFWRGSRFPRSFRLDWGLSNTWQTRCGSCLESRSGCWEGSRASPGISFGRCCPPAC